MTKTIMLAAAAILILLAGCETNLLQAGYWDPEKEYWDPGSDRTFNVSVVVAEACEVTSVDDMEDMEDSLRLLGVTARAGLIRDEALLILLDDCPNAPTDSISDRADCAICSEAMINYVYGP